MQQHGSMVANILVISELTEVTNIQNFEKARLLFSEL